MNGLQFAAFALLTGLTIGGMTGSIVELVSGRLLSFQAQPGSPRRLLGSLACTAAVGPFMLVNDALRAWRARRVSTAFLIGCGLTALAWLLATGIVALDLASRAAVLLS